MLDAAAVAGGGRLGADFLDVALQLAGEIGALPGDAGEAVAQVVAMCSLGGLAEALLAVPAGGNEVVERVQDLTHDT